MASPRKPRDNTARLRIAPPGKDKPGAGPRVSFQVNPDSINLILDTFANTDQPLYQVIEDVRAHDVEAPSLTTFRKLIAGNVDGIGDRYAHARKIRADAMLDAALDISNDQKLDVVFDEEGKPRVDGSAVQRSKLRADVRIKIAEKLNPAYSTRPQPNGGESGSPEQDLATLSDDDLTAALESALAELGVVLVPADPVEQLAEVRRLAAALGYALVKAKLEGPDTSSH